MKRKVGEAIKGFAAKKALEASLTIEAAFSLTIFMFTVILLAVPMEMLDTQRKIQTVLETRARELSQYAYLAYRNSLGEELGDIAGETDTAGETDSADLSGFLAEGALKAVLAAEIGEAAGRRISGLDLSETSVSGDGEEIYLHAGYKLRLPFRIFLLDSIPAEAGSFKRGWIGSEGGRSSGDSGTAGEETMVYVGRKRTRYHRSPYCHYISNDIMTVSWDSIENQVSSSGVHYKACRVCGSGAGAGSTVYIMQNGEYYHSRYDCSSIAFYVEKVPLAEVAHLGACSYCGKGE